LTATEPDIRARAIQRARQASSLLSGGCPKESQSKKIPKPNKQTTTIENTTPRTLTSSGVGAL
jgi:hypothetical protein